MTKDAEIAVNGETLLALGAGALFWPDRETLIVSDLHFEKGSNFAMRGVFLPPYDTRATLHRLAAVVKTHRPKTIISLGDAFHDPGADRRMEKSDADLLASFVGAFRWIWVLGNHDPEPPARFAGEVERSLRLGRLLFRHEAFRGSEPGEISGHFHPVARVRAEGRLIRRRCFASDGERALMPAFGAYAGGLNILDEAYDGIFKRAMTVWMMGASGVYPFTEGALLPDSGTQRRRAG